MHHKQPSARTGPRAHGYGTPHSILRLSLGILLAIAVGTALAACGPVGRPAHPVAATSTPTATTPARPGGGPTTPAGAPSTPGTSAPSSPSGPPTTPATTPANHLVAVPPIDGETLQQAVIDLHQAGLQLGTMTTGYTAQYDFGLIMSSVPPQGSFVQPGSAVNVTVSKAGQFYRGSPAIVPAVVGDTLAVAEAALGQAKISAGQPVYQQSDSVSQGIVISSSPPGGTKIDAARQEVVLTVSSGPPPQAGPPVSG